MVVELDRTVDSSPGEDYLSPDAEDTSDGLHTYIDISCPRARPKFASHKILFLQLCLARIVIQPWFHDMQISMLPLSTKTRIYDSERSQ